MMHFLTSDLRKNLTKILCLTVGLAVGFLLVAKIYFEQTYDTFFPDSDRIYCITEHIVQNNEYKEYPHVPGAIAPGLKQYVTQVEEATRITFYIDKTVMRLPDGRGVDVDALALADSCFFNIFQTDVISGYPPEVLAVDSHCMIPRSVADRIGEDPVGMTVTFSDLSDDFRITIGGVYEDFPLNSMLGNWIYISLPTIARIGYDGSDNWLGNDCYNGFVSLVASATPDDIKEQTEKMLRGHVPAEAIDDFHFGIGLKPLVGSYTSQTGVRTMTLMLSLLAVVILMCAGLNYLLIVIGQLGYRAKEMAIRKCYGTPVSGIFLRVMGESLFFIVVSLALALLVSFALAGLCKELLGYTPAQLFSTGRVWAVEGAVCAALFIVTGVVPGIIYSHTPVTGAFRVNVRSRRGWKLALLAVQFFAAGLVACLLVTVGRQYGRIVSLDLGFEYENVGRIFVNGLPQSLRSALAEELQRLPGVESVTTTWMDFSQKASGNNIWTENGNYGDNYNVADLYFANPSVFDVLGIEFVQGAPFSAQADSARREVVVEERMIGVLQRVFGVEESNIVGQRFYITGHDSEADEAYPKDYTICGVVRNMRRGGYEDENVDSRPGVIFPNQKWGPIFYVRFDRLTPEALHEAQMVIDRLVPAAEIYITPWRTMIEAMRRPVRRFGMAVMVVGIAIVVIALVGLIGYTADEVQRRAKEIAVRKVCGTSARAIVRLFCIDILRVALPSLLMGGLVAAEISRRWLMQFTERVTPGFLWMALALILLLALLLAVVAANSLRVARSNPILHLRSE